MNHNPPSHSDPDLAEKKAGLGNEPRGLLDANDIRSADGSSIQRGEDLLDLQDLDPAMNMKMHLVNNVSGNPPIFPDTYQRRSMTRC